jgi:hypothetical protein
MHCFGTFAMRAHISRALRLSASVTMSAFRRGCWLQTLCFGSSRQKVHGARSSIPASVFRQGRRGSIRIGVHRRLTIRSSRPHVVASATCYALRLHVSAAPPRVGLTQALGGRKAFVVLLSSAAYFPGFGLAVFGQFIGTFRLRWLHGARSNAASVALAGFGNSDRRLIVFPRRTRSFGDGRQKGLGARSGLTASVFGKHTGPSISPASLAT